MHGMASRPCQGSVGTWGVLETGEIVAEIEGSLGDAAHAALTTDP
jgi:hypothetical protein